MQKRSSFTSSIGFVMAAAGSAVGLGNIWRFPYLAAKDGGGIFLFIYLILALTFGFTLLITEIAIGRKTKSSAYFAYSKVDKRWKFIGFLATLNPAIIFPFYCVVGGWVIQYFIIFITGQGSAAASETYFNNFISSNISPIVTFLLFTVLSIYVVYRGVNKGIEKLSTVLMPFLFLLIIIISIYSLTISYTDSSGVTRTGMEGLWIYLIPNFSGLTIKRFFQILFDAIGQIFFSLSVAGGTMITYGSYMRDEDNLNRSVNQIEIFDTIVAFLAGVMIIPAVYAFSGYEGLNSSGPGLLFIAMPKIFNEMGTFGNIMGFIFFAMIFFASITSSISLLEAVTVSFMERFKMNRVKALTWSSIWSIFWGTAICLGYNIFYFDIKLPNGSSGQLLDVMDYIANQLSLPLVAICTCILIGWVAGSDYVVNEVEKSGTNMSRKPVYQIMIKFIAPILLFILLLQSFGINLV